MTGPIERVDPFETPHDDPCEPQAVADPELHELRERITEIDRELVRLLSRRVATAREARARKQQLGVDVYDPVREAAVVRRAAVHARQVGLDAESVREIFWRVIRIARDAQTRTGG